MSNRCICTRSGVALAALASLALAGSAFAGGGNPACNADAGPCDVPNGTPGCDDIECCNIVCAADAFCCETEWDQICADAAAELCGGGKGNPACNADAGPCDAANGTPGCDDVECCNLVCDADPFCCDTEWDDACAAGAADLCGGGGGVCGPGNGDCFIANGTPGCDDVDCCNLICGQDPFCCDTEWDGICACAAVAQCGEPCEIECEGSAEGEPCGEDTNGGCNSTPVVFGAIACGETICGTGWADGGTRDTDWYIIETTADCTTLTSTLVAEFPAVTFIVSGIDNCAPVVEGQAGDSAQCAAGLPAVADVGPGTYVVFVAPSGFEGFPCGTNNDYSVTLDCNENCEPPGPICGKGAGPCNQPNGTPGCEDVACCETVCAADPFCCDVEWDQICADAAAQLCGEPCDLVCEGTDEGEACGDDTNGGCNSTPVAFGAIACGETICGTGWGDGGTRDTDWFLITTEAECTTLTATLVSEFAGVTFIVSGIDNCAPVVEGQAGDSSFCEAGLPAVADVPAGTYVVFVAPTVFEGLPCGGGNNDYSVTLDCNENCEPPGPVCGEGAGSCNEPNGTPGCEDVECCETVCAADPFCCDVEWDQICADAAAELCNVVPVCDCEGDFDDDGVVGAADLASLLADWNTGGTVFENGCSTDIDGSGNVDAADLAALLANWGDCDGGGGGPANDDCEDREDIADGSTDYSTLMATTDGNPHAGCQFDGQTYHDVWYNYIATCTGSLTVSTCDAADYDTDLVVYSGCDNCAPGDDDVLGCNDDATGCGGFSSEVVVDVVEGNCYKIRVGGWNEGDMGNGTLTITCGGGGGDPVCGKGAGPCDVPNGTPGCDDVACCELICGLDPFCCETEWDQICADAAIANCGG